MKKSVLVVEDNEQNLYLMRYLLEENGYECISARDGKKGIELATQIKPAIILLDIINDTWAGNFWKIQSGEIDIIGMMAGVAADDLGILISSQHIDFPATVYGKRDSALVINSLADLKGLRVSCFKDILFPWKYLDAVKTELKI